jgi:hypothetical protein
VASVQVSPSDDATIGDEWRGHSARSTRVQLEGKVHDRNLVAVREPLQRSLEPSLAEVAPRADDVGPDLDLHGPPQGTGHP